MTAPLNDNFADAESIAPDVPISASNVDATKEPGEPDHAGNAGGSSVWWKFSVNEYSSVTISTTGSGFDTTLGVYTGASIDSLTEVASDDDSGGDGTSKVVFPADSGVVYTVAVDGYGGEQGAVEISMVAERVMKISNTGLLAWRFPFTQEGLINIGNGKFVIICNRYSWFSIGFVVVSVDQEGEITFGTPGEFESAFTSTNPLAYYDSLADRVVILYDDNPADKYILASVSGMSLSEIHRGTLTSGKKFHYGVSYDESAGAAVLCSRLDTPSSTFGFFSLTLNGTSFVEYDAGVQISGIAIGYIVKISPCGDHTVAAFANSIVYPYVPEIRVLDNVGLPSFGVSSGYAVPVAEHEYCLGVSGGSDGDFIWYGAADGTNIPYILAGEINSSGVPSFGLEQLQYVPDEEAWGVGSYGEFIGSGAGAGGGLGVFAMRINGDSIHMFSVKNENLEPSVINTDSSTSGLWLESESYDHVPISFDTNTGIALCAFFVRTGSTSGEVYAAAMKVSIPAPIFWQNHTLQKEFYSKHLEKRPTNKVIPGKAGQPYVAPIPATSSKSSVYHKSEKSCKRVGV